MSGRLPRRGVLGPAESWCRFLGLAAYSRSARELLAATLKRPVLTRPISNHVIAPAAPLVPLQLAVGQHPVRILEHLLLDSRPPYPPLGLSSAVVVAARLPAQVRGPVRRGREPLDAVLERGGDFWTAETCQSEHLSVAEASYATGRTAEVPLLRLTRLLYLLGTPVALVVEEIPLPAGRGPPPGRPST